MSIEPKSIKHRKVEYLGKVDLVGANLGGANLDDVIGADFSGALYVPNKYLKN